jgi:cytochrome d ubiquinol oxidase subunit II
MLGGLVLYMLGGGADFGGGVWDLFAWGPRKDAQRALIERAIGPVWEANHVWFIFVFVLLFTAFPPAFALMTTALFGPLTVYALGLVLRGSAFTFRHYDEDPRRRQRFGAVFSAASIGCPFLLGEMGALMVRDAPLAADMTSPFAVASGVFALALTSALAAIYLTVEAGDPALREDFRVRALVSLLVAGAASWVALLIGREAATSLFSRVGFGGAAAVAGLLGFAALALVATRRFALARAAVVLLTTTVVVGWGLAKGEVLVPPDVTIAASKAHPATLRVLLGSCAVGALVLVPSLLLLFKVFAPIRQAGEAPGGPSVAPRWPDDG